MVDCDLRQGRIKLSTWIEQVREHFNPSYDEAHNIVYKIEQIAKKK